MSVRFPTYGWTKFLNPSGTFSKGAAYKISRCERAKARPAFRNAQSKRAWARQVTGSYAVWPGSTFFGSFFSRCGSLSRDRLSWHTPRPELFTLNILFGEVRLSAVDGFFGHSCPAQVRLCSYRSRTIWSVFRA
jgi:hypothetical protein